METLGAELTPKEKEKEIKKAFETIRPELNIEKHADFFFAPSHSRNIHKPRSRTWIEELPDGTKVKATIYLEPFQGKIPTTKTRKLYLALCKVWEEKGWNENEETLFSINEVADAAGWSWHGNKTIREIRNELRQLNGTTSIWQHSFTNEKGERVSLEQPFRILENYKILTKAGRDTKQLYLALSSYRFHEEIRKNLKANHTKPTNLVALEIQGEIASVLYARLEIVMADKFHYERTTAGLFQDLFIEGEKYRYPSARKQNLQKAIKELEGKPISTGILHLHLEQARETKDWKLVVTKEPVIKERPRVHIPERVGDANPPEAVPYLVGDLAALIGGLPKNQNYYTLIFKCYSTELVYQAMAEWKADGGRTARTPGSYFSAILHRLAHERGKLWLNRPCPETCKYRTPRTSYEQPQSREV